jgi:hypothetical protein
MLWMQMVRGRGWSAQDTLTEEKEWPRNRIRASNQRGEPSSHMTSSSCMSDRELCILKGKPERHKRYSAPSPSRSLVRPRTVRLGETVGLFHPDDAGLFVRARYGFSIFDAHRQHAPERDVHRPGSGISTEPALGTSLPITDIGSQIAPRTRVGNSRDASHKTAPGVPSARL